MSLQIVTFPSTRQTELRRKIKELQEHIQGNLKILQTHLADYRTVRDIVHDEKLTLLEQTSQLMHVTSGASTMVRDARHMLMLIHTKEWAYRLQLAVLEDDLPEKLIDEFFSFFEDLRGGLLKAEWKTYMKYGLYIFMERLSDWLSKGYADRIQCLLGMYHHLTFKERTPVIPTRNFYLVID